MLLSFSLRSLPLAFISFLLTLSAVAAYNHCYYSSITAKDEYIGDLFITASAGGSIQRQATVDGGTLTVVWSPTSEDWTLFGTSPLDQELKWYKVAFDLGDGGIWPYYISNKGECEGLWGGKRANLKNDEVKGVVVYLHN